MKFLSGFKKVTHAIAAGVAVGAGWVIANPQVVKPAVEALGLKGTAATVAGLIIAAVYHDSK